MAVPLKDEKGEAIAKSFQKILKDTGCNRTN